MAAARPQPHRVSPCLPLTCTSPGGTTGAVESTFPLRCTNVPSLCQESGRGLKKANIVLWQSPASVHYDFFFFLIIVVLWHHENGFLPGLNLLSSIQS